MIHAMRACRWIQDQLVNHREDVWLDGVEDYIGHAKGLLMEAADSDSPVSGLKEGASQACTDGQRADDPKAAMNGSQSRESKPAATGQFALPSFGAPPGEHSAVNSNERSSGKDVSSSVRPCEAMREMLSGRGYTSTLHYNHSPHASYLMALSGTMNKCSPRCRCFRGSNRPAELRAACR